MNGLMLIGFTASGVINFIVLTLRCYVCNEKSNGQIGCAAGRAHQARRTGSPAWERGAPTSGEFMRIN